MSRGPMRAGVAWLIILAVNAALWVMVWRALWWVWLWVEPWWVRC